MKTLSVRLLHLDLIDNANHAGNAFGTVDPELLLVKAADMAAERDHAAASIHPQRRTARDAVRRDKVADAARQRFVDRLLFFRGERC